MKTVFIYSLSTKEKPTDIRYIGKTNNISNRLKRHVSKYYLNENTYKSRWLQKELRNGCTPIIEVIDEVPESEWDFWEQYWISQFKSWGFNLTNTTIGGDGLTITKEIIIKRTKTNFNKNSIKLNKEIKEFNIRLENEKWISENTCPQCKALVVHKNHNRSNALKNSRRFKKENRICISCDYKNRNGSGNSFFGKTHTSELQNFLRNVAPKKKVIMLSMNDEVLKEFNSIREAEKETKINRRHISGCCNNHPHYHSAGGYKWKFK